MRLDFDLCLMLSLSVHPPFPFLSSLCSFKAPWPMPFHELASAFFSVYDADTGVAVTTMRTVSIPYPLIFPVLPFPFPPITLIIMIPEEDTTVLFSGHALGVRALNWPLLLMLPSSLPGCSRNGAEAPSCPRLAPLRPLITAPVAVLLPILTL